ncbi:MAG: nickel pincer cofactor biosynthesis protein LarC [Candidatus Thorarchaeota archaeon]
MKSLIIDGQISGASGDMFLGALLDLYSKQQQIHDDSKILAIIRDIANKIVQAAKLDNQAKISIELIRKNIRAVEGIYLKIAIEEPHRHLHYPQAMAIIEEAIKLMGLSEKGGSFSKRALEILFEAESKAHGEPIEKVHLHEAGSLDTFLDILGTAYLLEKIGLFDVLVSVLPINLGSGTVTFSHGTLPVPAPAVENIVKQYQIPSFIGTITGEMFTPTGAMIIASLLTINNHMKTLAYSPPMFFESNGIGFGTKELEKSPNALRLIYGSTLEDQLPREEITIIETNIDDCSGEVIGFLSNRLLELGAKDVYLTPIYMKKGRPGTKISVLCDPKDEVKFSSEIMNQTSTIGVRLLRSTKLMLSRKIAQFEIEINNKKWAIQGKIAYTPNGDIAHFKPEFDDVKLITEQTGLTINEVISLARQKIASELKNKGK